MGRQHLPRVETATGTIAAADPEAARCACWDAAV
jgi:hypothetical protein